MPEPKKRPLLVDSLIRLLKEQPLGSAGLVIVVIFFIVGIFANFLAPYGFNEYHAGYFHHPPCRQFIFGTDNLGRDMLSRIIYGARISMLVGLIGSSIYIFICTAIGVLCGLFGGKFDLIVQRLVDAWMCFPLLIIFITIMSLVGAGMFQLVIIIGIGWGIGGSRIVRSAVISIKENMYMDAARTTGCSTWKMVQRHILPNIAAPIIILFSTGMPGLILTEASLSFLGYGIPPPTPSWGGMLSGSGRRYMIISPWMAIWPGLAISIVVYGINMFGDALRDVLDPRMRGGVGRYGGVKMKAKGGVGM